jgi:PTS system ascorbate-specific IIA component
MTVGIALITHPGIGTALKRVAERLLGRLPLALDCIEVPFDSDLDQLLPVASAVLRRLDQGAGILLLSDLYGASPCNFAARMSTLGFRIRRVAGLNLPMLLRAMNYADRELDQLADTAAAGGRLGVIIDHA